MNERKLVKVINIGDEVLCDLCNESYPAENKESGGFLFQSKAICPKCAPAELRSITQYREERFIRAYCPQGMSFHDWVMQLRGGDNTIRIYHGGMP